MSKKLLSARKRSPEYRSWNNMLTRCTNPRRATWPRYGGRGICVCERWRASFEAFLEDMGPRPSRRHSLDRIDNDGHYEPGNCRWATTGEQARNTSACRVLEIDGKRAVMKDWAERSGLSYWTVRSRVDRGTLPERALQSEALRNGNYRPAEVHARIREALLAGMRVTEIARLVGVPHQMVSGFRTRMVRAELRPYNKGESL